MVDKKKTKDELVDKIDLEPTPKEDLFAGDVIWLHLHEKKKTKPRPVALLGIDDDGNVVDYNGDITYVPLTGLITEEDEELTDFNTDSLDFQDSKIAVKPIEHWKEVGLIKPTGFRLGVRRTVNINDLPEMIPYVGNLKTSDYRGLEKAKESLIDTLKELSDIDPRDFARLTRQNYANEVAIEAGFNVMSLTDDYQSTVDLKATHKFYKENYANSINFDAIVPDEHEVNIKIPQPPTAPARTSVDKNNDFDLEF